MSGMTKYRRMCMVLVRIFRNTQYIVLACTKCLIGQVLDVYRNIVIVLGRG